MSKANHRILIVDDEEAYRHYLSEALTRESFSVETAAAGPEAVAIARDFRPDLLVVDLRLAGTQDGLTVAARLREQYADLRIIVITGFATLDEASPRPIAVDRVLEKPFGPDEFVNAVREILDAA